ncbi:MAG: phage tail tape measure protein, partial [Thermotogota bacterium]
MLNNMGAGFILRAYDAATPVVKKVGAAFGWLQKGVKKLNLGGAMSSSLGTSAMGYAALNVGTQMLELMKTAADAGGAFEQRMIGVQQIAGATGEELVAMKDMAIDAALATAFTPLKVAEAYEVLSSMGLRAQEQMDALIPSLQLATGSMGNLGIAGAAQAVVGSIKSMNFSLKESARVTDQLLKIEQLTNFSTKDFELVLGRTASAAKMYGQSWEDALISIGLIRNLNIDAEVASTSLREAWRLMASDESAQQAIQQRGVDIFDKQTGKMRDALSIILDLTEKTAKLNDRERMRMLTIAFGVRGISTYNAVQNASFTAMKNGEPIILSGANAINAMRYELSQNGDTLTKNQEAALKLALGVENLSDVLRTSKGVAKVYQSALLDTYAGQKQLIDSGFNTFLTVLGEDFAKAMKPWTIMLHEAIVGVTDFIRSLSPEARQMILKFVVSIGAIITLAGGLMLVSGVLNMLGGSVLGFVFSIGKLVLIGIPILMLLSGLGIGIKSLSGAFGIGGKSGLSFEKVLHNVQLALSGMMSILSGEGFSDSLKKEFEKAENQGVVAFLGKFENWLERIKSFWKGIKTGFGDGVKELSESSAFKRLQDKISGLINIFI